MLLMKKKTTNYCYYYKFIYKSYHVWEYKYDYDGVVIGGGCDGVIICINL